MTRKFRPTTVPECHVEIARLERLLGEALEQKRRVEHENTRLHESLNVAQAGVELAELIKRITA